MASFDEPNSKIAATQSQPEHPPLAYPTQEELAIIREEARLIGHEEGYAAGREQGLAAGLEDGRATGREEGHAAGHAAALALGKIESARELLHLHALAQQFGTALADADQLISNDILELALHMAKAMLKTALRVKPELILPVVREAIQSLPVLQQPALLILNPEDARVVQESMGEQLKKEGWRVVEDADLGRGGCRIDTASNQIDADAALRWQRLTHALGKDLDWLAP